MSVIFLVMVRLVTRVRRLGNVGEPGVWWLRQEDRRLGFGYFGGKGSRLGFGIFWGFGLRFNLGFGL